MHIKLAKELGNPYVSDTRIKFHRQIPADPVIEIHYDLSFNGYCVLETLNVAHIHARKVESRYPYRIYRHHSTPADFSSYVKYIVLHHVARIQHNHLR